MSAFSAFLIRFDSKLSAIAASMEGKRVRFYPTITGALVMIVFSIAVLVLMPSQVNIDEGEIITARTFPTLLAYIMLGGSVLLLIQEAVKVIRKRPLQTRELELLTEVKALVLLVLFVLYAVLMTLTGFIVASAIYSVLMLVYFREKRLHFYPIVVVAAVIIGIIFRNVLNVRLP